MLNHGGMRKSGSGGAGSGRALHGDSLVDTKGETLGRQKAQEVGEKTERSHERREKALGKRSRCRIAQWRHFHRRPLVDGGSGFICSLFPVDALWRPCQKETTNKDLQRPT